MKPLVYGLGTGALTYVALSEWEPWRWIAGVIVLAWLAYILRCARRWARVDRLYKSHHKIYTQAMEAANEGRWGSFELHVERCREVEEMIEQLEK